VSLKKNKSQGKAADMAVISKEENSSSKNSTSRNPELYVSKLVLAATNLLGKRSASICDARGTSSPLLQDDISDIHEIESIMS
jgi:hypothetical protein